MRSILAVAVLAPLFVGCAADAARQTPAAAQPASPKKLAPSKVTPATSTSRRRLRAIWLAPFEEGMSSVASDMIVSRERPKSRTRNSPVDHLMPRIRGGSAI